jgi:hypothetical protein
LQPGRQDRHGCGRHRAARCVLGDQPAARRRAIGLLPDREESPVTEERVVIVTDAGLPRSRCVEDLADGWTSTSMLMQAHRRCQRAQALGEGRGSSAAIPMKTVKADPAELWVKARKACSLVAVADQVQVVARTARPRQAGTGKVGPGPGRTACPASASAARHSTCNTAITVRSDSPKRIAVLLIPTYEIIACRSTMAYFVSKTTVHSRLPDEQQPQGRGQFATSARRRPWESTRRKPVPSTTCGRCVTALHERVAGRPGPGPGSTAARSGGWS